MIVLDTHALLWWAIDPDKLSGEARKVVVEMERHGGFASAISIWEIGIKVKRGKLELPISVDEMARRSNADASSSSCRSTRAFGCVVFPCPGITPIPRTASSWPRRCHETCPC